MKRILLTLLPGVLALAGLAQQTPSDDALLRAMNAELERSRTLRLLDLEAPYYIEYAVHDDEFVYSVATLGALVDARRQGARLPRIRVRVGDYKFDNGNYIYSDSSTGSRYALGSLPIEDIEQPLRRYFWLATDMTYKSALEVIARKRAALRNLTVTDQTTDFAKAEPTKLILPPVSESVDEQAWNNRARSLSAIFQSYPEVTSSSVQFQAVHGLYYLVNSEGTQVRVPENSVEVEVRGSALAADGMSLRDSTLFLSHEVRDLPVEEQLRLGTQAVADNLRALIRSPVGESYTGPVLFEPLAAAQLMADMMGRNLGYRRRPVTEGGRAISFLESEFEGRVGSRILPEWMDVVDDPTVAEWGGKPLFGHYLVDLEGVVPKPLPIVEKGVLRNLLATRQPVKGNEVSNGRARLRGSYLSNNAAFGTLFVRASESTTLAGLRQKLMEMSTQRGKPYGILIRKMDFPSTASGAEMRTMAARAAQDGTAGRMVSSPLLAYRVYPDGREELVRGLRFKGLTTRALRDIEAAGGDPIVFNYLENSAPMALSGAASFVAECSVIAPGLLFDEMQLERSEEVLPKLPVVDPPPLISAR